MRLAPAIRPVVAALAAAAVAAAVLPSTAQAAPDPSRLTIGFGSALASFDQPVAVTSARDGRGRLFVLEKTGRIRVYANGSVQQAPYLDLSRVVSTESERGLLGLAFSPTFSRDHMLWVAYTTSTGALRVARYTQSAANPNVADASRAATLLEVPHPGQANHNAGQLAFGRDGLLYLGTGDGGGAGDPNNNALNLASKLGKILRIDPRRSCSGLRYCIPSSNPFASTRGAYREIWGYGLRNPWKFSFDRSNGMLYVADVGQGAREEIDRVSYGYPYAPNFGWSCYEGYEVYAASRCRNLGHLVKPSIAYAHKSGYSCGGSVIGGYVYRGSTYASILSGIYVFADYCYGHVYVSSGTGLRKAGSLGGIAGFGESDTGELYAVSVSTGGLYRLRASA